MSDAGKLVKDVWSNEAKTIYYVFKFKVKNRKRNGKRKIYFHLEVYEGVSEKPEKLVFATGVPDWYPVIDYLQFDERYAQGRDYSYRMEKRRTKIGEVEVPQIVFYNSESARRTMVYMLSIIGTNKNSKWISLMKNVVRNIDPEDVEFWVRAIQNRYTMASKIGDKRLRGIAKRSLLMRTAKAIRLFYEHVDWWFKA